jgi:hypothetical protein
VAGCIQTQLPTTMSDDDKPTAVHRRKYYLLLLAATLFGSCVFSTASKLLWNHISPLYASSLALAGLETEYNGNSQKIGEIGKPSPLPPTSATPPRTLLIIQGAYRTFDFTVDSIIENLIETNSPCEVVVSLDTAPSQEPHSYLALEKLRPYLLRDAGVIYPDPGEGFLTPATTAVEFIQHHRALTRVNLSSYDFLMKARTDVVIQQSIRFTTALGYNEAAFHIHFPSFVAELLEYDPESTPEEVIYTWFMTAGNPFYIPHMSKKRNIHMSWSPIGPHDINHALQDAVAKEWQLAFEEKNGEKTGEDNIWSLLKTAEDVILQLVRKVAREQHVMYMAGNTWVGFGLKEDFVPVYETIYEDYGKYSWNQWRGPGWNGSHKWVYGDHVTESHFRLSHLQHNKSLVDLMNLVDHQVTFVLEEKCFGHQYLRSAKELAVYILRERQVMCLPDRLPLQALDPHKIYEDYEYQRG